MTDFFPLGCQNPVVALLWAPSLLKLQPYFSTRPFPLVQVPSTLRERPPPAGSQEPSLGSPMDISPSARAWGKIHWGKGEQGAA